MRRPEAPGYEGAANLLAAFRVAADPQSRDRGTLVVLNDEIQSAREVTKTDAQRLDTFQTRGYGAARRRRHRPRRLLPHVRSSGTRRDRSSTSTGVASLPRVDVLLTYQGAPGDLIRAAVDARRARHRARHGRRRDQRHAGRRRALRERAQGVVVRTTRTGSGRIMGGAEPRIAASAPACGRIADRWT